MRPPLSNWRRGSTRHARSDHEHPIGDEMSDIPRALFTRMRHGTPQVTPSPAGATTLIISLGILTTPWQLLLLMVAVVLLTAQAFVINRLVGIPYPLWNPRSEQAERDKKQQEEK